VIALPARPASNGPSTEAGVSVHRKKVRRIGGPRSIDRDPRSMTGNGSARGHHRKQDCQYTRRREDRSDRLGCDEAIRSVCAAVHSAEAVREERCCAGDTTGRGRAATRPGPDRPSTMRWSYSTRGHFSTMAMAQAPVAIAAPASKIGRNTADRAEGSPAPSCSARRWNGRATPGRRVIPGPIGSGWK
jgi:hypothetical protein